MHFGAVEARFEINVFMGGVVAQIGEQVRKDGLGIVVEFLAAFFAGGVVQNRVCGPSGALFVGDVGHGFLRDLATAVRAEYRSASLGCSSVSKIASRVSKACRSS